MSQHGKGKLFYLEGDVRAEPRREVRHVQVGNAEVGLTIPSASLEITQDVLPLFLENGISVL